jgi:hypothetical protein
VAFFVAFPACVSPVAAQIKTDLGAAINTGPGASAASGASLTGGSVGVAPITNLGVAPLAGTMSAPSVAPVAALAPAVAAPVSAAAPRALALVAAPVRAASTPEPGAAPVTAAVAAAAPALSGALAAVPSAASSFPGNALPRAAVTTGGVQARVDGVRAAQANDAGAESERAAAGALFGEGGGSAMDGPQGPSSVVPITRARRGLAALTKAAAPSALSADAGFDEETVHDIFLRVLNTQIEGAAADAHDVGWKKSKDEALANPDDPFVGWAPTRIRVTEELKTKTREELSRLVGTEVSEAKYRALKTARLGQDVTHPLFKPYADMLKDQADGGMRLSGQNALPLLVLTLYLSDMRRQETRTKAGFQRVLDGLIDGTDRKGVAELSRIMHVAFQGAQLVYGERGVENTVKGVKIPARGDFKPFDALHQDVQELDSYTLMPAARWLREHGAGLPAQQPLHAFSELLTLGPEQLGALPILTAPERLAELRRSAALFERRYAKLAALIKLIDKNGDARAAEAEARGDKAGAKAARAEASSRKSRTLWGVANAFGVENLSPDQLTTLFMAFKKEGLWADMIKLYDASISLPFRRATAIREFLAVALHKTGDLARSEAVIHRLGDARMSGEAYAILGKINKLRYAEFTKAGDRDQAHAALAQSIKDLEAGFLKDFEFYPGINLVYNMITEGSERGDAAEIEKAERLAHLVYLSALKAGGLQSNDFWTVTTVLEAAIVNGRDDEAAAALPRVLATASAAWEIQAPIDNLLQLRGQANALGSRLAGSEKLVARIDAVVAALNDRKENLSRPLPAQPRVVAKDTPAARKAAKLFAIGFRFGEIKSNDVGGNINFGGQLHSEVANRWDFAVARELLRYKGLDKPETDFARFNETVDEMIRTRFGTAGLEDLHGEDHDAYDKFVKTLLDTMGVEKGQDSRTNIMVDFWLGKGDCRHHAYAKQLLFDIWKTDKINALMREAYAALGRGDVPAYDGAMARVHEWEGVHMLTLDSVVRAPIVVTEKYHPVLTGDGVPVHAPDGSLSDVEDHTWNLLFRVNDAGELVSASSVDSFYQQVYPFGGGAGVPLSLDDIREDGVITAGRPIDLLDAGTGRTVRAFPTLVPTGYAGQDKRVKADTGDYGDRVLLRGISIDALDSREGRPDVSNYFDPAIKGAIERFAERMRHEGRAAVVARLEAAVPGMEVVGDAAPSIDDWSREINAIMKQGGIPPENYNAVAALLEVGVDESRPGKQTAFRLLVRPQVSMGDIYGKAAARVAALATPVIGLSAPRLDRWGPLNGWIEKALAETGVAKPKGSDIRRVRERLVMGSSATGRRFFVRVRDRRQAVNQ